jgi:iron(III) transport system substrate-binding protein
MLLPGLSGKGLWSSAFAEAAPTAMPLADLEAAAQKEGSLVFYSLGDFGDWTDGFKKHYPWVKTETFASAPAEITNKVLTESATGAPTADVIMMPPARGRAIIDAGAVAQVRVEAESKLDPGLIDPEGYTHPFYSFLIPLVYNTNLGIQPPKDIFELADPKWKDKFALDRPQNLGVSSLFLASHRKVWGDDKWKQWLDGLKANNVFIAADATAAYEAVLRGERQIAADSLADVLAQAKGTPMAAFFYDGGVVRYPNNLWLMSKARHPNVGALFINWMLTEEGQRIIAAGGRTPVLDIDTDVTESKLLPPGATVFDPANVADYFANPADYEAVWEQYWPAG